MSTRKMNVSELLTSAIHKDNLTQVKQLVKSHGLSHREGWFGGHALLLVAVKSNRFEIAKFLVQKGAKVNCKIDYLDTPLHFAAESGCEELARLLVKKGALIDAHNNQNATPLHLAAKGGHLIIVELLLTNAANVDARTYAGSTPLLLAANGGHRQVVKVLLKKGACVNAENERGETALLFAIEWEDSTLLKCIMPLNPKINDKVYEAFVEIITDEDVGHSSFIDDLTDYGFTLSRKYSKDCDLMAAAVKKGYLKIVENLLVSGADLTNSTYASGLVHSAIQEGRLDIAELLLKNGCDVDLKLQDGRTALHVAFMNENKEAISLLLDLKANINLQANDGVTALHIAAQKGQNELVKLLCKKKADVNVRKAEGLTPLHIAAKKGHKKMVQMLLNFGADIDAQTDEKSTPAHLAVAKERDEVIHILIQNGCDISVEDKYGHCVLKEALEMADDDSDGSGDSWTGRTSSNEIINCTMKYAIRLMVAGLFVSKKVLERINLDYFLYHQRAYEREIEEMKKEILCCHLTVHSILLSRMNPKYRKNESVMQKLESYDFKKFPVYQTLITRSIQNGKRRLKLLNASQKCLNTLIKTSNTLNQCKSLIFPAELLEEIVSYLNDSDLTSLIRCVEDLKHLLGL